MDRRLTDRPAGGSTDDRTGDLTDDGTDGSIDGWTDGSTEDGTVVSTGRSTGGSTDDGTQPGAPVSTYQPMRLADLAELLTTEQAGSDRRRLVLEFLEEWHWEPPVQRARLLADEPGPVGDERYDVLLAALAEHLAAIDNLAAPEWSEHRSLRTFWFPDDTPAGRADALVRSPAALRRRGIFIAAEDLVRV